MLPPRVITVGAGAAGLAAAWRLARAGCEVSVLERAPRPGGRLTGRVREGFTLEPGAQLLSTGDRSLGELLAELGRGDELLALRSGAEGQLRAGWVHESRGEGLHAIARLPGVSPLAALRVLRLERLLRRFGAHLDPRAPERAAPHDDRSLADFARLYFGPRLLERWAGPSVTSDCLGDESQTSRVLFLLRYLAHRGQSPALFRSGAGGFAEALAARLDVRAGTEATGVEADGPGGALLRFRENGVEGTIGADAVVVATPAGVAAELAKPLLSPAERDFFAGVGYEPAITLQVALGDPIVPRFVRVRVPREEASPLASLVLEPGRPGGRVPDGCAAARLVARSDWSREHLDQPDDALEKELLGWLVRLFPAAAERVRFAEVARWPCALPRFQVGRYRALARFARVQEDRAASGRRVYFAGDYLVAPSVEGAITSGFRAADAVRADLGA